MFWQTPRRLASAFTSTLNLPRSTLPSRPHPSDLANYLKRCADDLYEWQRARPPSAVSGDFVLHDGPPYANGGLHVGHALNKITKDIICRFQLGQGKRVNYIPGWDCHGLPIEVKALQTYQRQSKGSRGALGPVEIRKLAKELAEDTVKEQMLGFRQWAVMGDWKSAYKSMDADFELRQLRLFQDMVVKGLIYRQYWPVYWSPSSDTALAEAELEYDENHISTAAFVKFPLSRVPEFLRIQLPRSDIRISVVIWTTTPWTLPANKAIAVHKDLQYSMIEEPESSGERLLLVSKSFIGDVQKIFSTESVKVVVDSIRGSDLVGDPEYINVFQGMSARSQPFIHADFVSDSSGTGLVHVAPGHGMDDYKVCSDLGIPAFSPVNDQSQFTKDACPHSPELLEGLDVQSDGTKVVIEFLRNPPEWISAFGNLVLTTHEYLHKYPIDWRTKQPIIVRATEQWFTDVESIRADAVSALKNVQFIPESSKSRLLNFILGRSQWCISRQRPWGVPIPALFRRNDSGKWDALMTGSSIAHIIKLIEHRGIDAWWTDPEDDMSWVSPELGPGTYKRGKDTMDVWFDSGTSWTLLKEGKDGKHIADVYLEGSDQHRGWFQSSLLSYVAHQSTRHSNKCHLLKAPYKTLITHGFVLDQKGLKMSKSVGNVTTPSQIISGKLLPPPLSKKTNIKKQHTNREAAASQHTKNISDHDALDADVLRLWVASCDYTKDVPINEAVVKTVHANLQKFRITFKWLLGVLRSYDPSLLTSSSTTRLRMTTTTNRFADILALHRLTLTAHAVHSFYSAYNHARAIAAINNFVNRDLSAFYFETAKDRLYTANLVERVPAQRTLFVIFDQLLRMLAPVTPLLVEEVVAHSPSSLVQLLSSPRADAEETEAWHPLRSIWRPYTLHPPGSPESQRLNKQFAIVEAVRAAVHSAQDMARAEGKIGSGLDSIAQIVLPERTLRDSEIGELFSKRWEDEWTNLLVLSDCKIYQVADGSEGISKDTDPQMWSFQAPIELEWFPLGDGGDGGENSQEAGVVVIWPTQGCKCPRCWRWVAPEVDRVCGRCEDALKEMGIDPSVPV